jgi:hypothetical protein
MAPTLPMCKPWPMATEFPKKGWHCDPSHPYSFRYWDGKRWSGRARTGPTGMPAASYSLTGWWQTLWFGRLTRNTVVFHILAWFNCSIPGTKGRLDRLMQPPQARTFRQLVS